MQEIESILHETRHFAPSEEFKSKAKLRTLEQYHTLYRQSLDDPDTFWSNVAQELHWFEDWQQVMHWEEPFVQWFVGGKTNISYNCLDLQIERGRGDKTAIIWEGENGDSLSISYSEMKAKVCQFANMLQSHGIEKGDRVAIYMPMIPEAAYAMQACARIGAIHSVVFGGFSSSALANRINDAEAKAVITADGGYRRGAVFPLKPAVDEALTECSSVQKVFVAKRGNNAIDWQAGRDIWLHEALAPESTECEAVPLDSEHPLFILYTSGSTGKPKGVLHSTGGYQTYTYLTNKYIFDQQDSDVFWCTADVGWITGHSYIVYGPLLNGVTQVMYEGVPNYPAEDRFWSIVAKHKVSIFYTAPTAIRAFMKWGDAHPNKHDLSSLRLLGTVGEPINPEAWMWYRRIIGRERCPIVDTWWQTETGGIMLTTLPGVHDAKPGSAGLPFFGVEPSIVDRYGNEEGVEEGGFLVMKRPWPSMIRTVYGDDARYQKQYWSKIEHRYFAGDGAKRDEDGYFWIMGRVDDVVNVAGHRLGTMEVESAIVAHPATAEAAVVSRPDALTGEALVAFVILNEGQAANDDLKDDLRDYVTQAIGAIAKPKDIHFTPALPKTRSGKIMRRLLKDIAAGRDVTGDVSTLEDSSVVEALVAQVK